MSEVKALYQRYKDMISYAIFGVLTTIVNIAIYWFAAHLITLPTMPSTIIAWTAAVLFAYLTNRRWVFHSEAHMREEVAKEIISFFACRLATGVVDWFCMWLLVDVLQLNDVVIKTMANVVVIVLNYIASKMVIFKRK